MPDDGTLPIEPMYPDPVTPEIQKKKKKSKVQSTSPEDEMRATLEAIKAQLLGQKAPSDDQIRADALAKVRAQLDPQISAIQNSLGSANATSGQMLGAVNSTYAELGAALASLMGGGAGFSGMGMGMPMGRGFGGRGMGFHGGGFRGFGGPRGRFVGGPMPMRGFHSAAPYTLGLPGNRAGALSPMNGGMMPPVGTAMGGLPTGGNPWVNIAQGLGNQQAQAIQSATAEYTQKQQAELAELQAREQNLVDAAVDKEKAQQQKNRNDTWSKILQVYGLEKDLLRGSRERARDEAKAKEKKKERLAPIDKVANSLQQYFKGTHWEATEPQRYTGIFKDLLLEIGKLPHALNDEQKLAKADEYARQLGISPTAMNIAMLAYLGKA